MGSTNEFSKFIPFFAKIGFFRGYEKWNIIVIITLDFSLLRVRRFLSGFIQLISLIRGSNLELRTRLPTTEIRIFLSFKIDFQKSVTDCRQHFVLLFCCWPCVGFVASNKNCCSTPKKRLPEIAFCCRKVSFYCSCCSIARVKKNGCFLCRHGCTQVCPGSLYFSLVDS